LPLRAYCAGICVRRRGRFNEIDRNRNGKITREEARAWLVKNLGSKWLQRVTDRGKAGTDQIFKREFDRMDTDHNGVITPGELDKSLR
jgi:Ca2+-binding EF-hand superfamily protein